MPVVNVSITGMTCGSCTYKVEDKIGDLPGVTDAKCDFKDNTGVFTLEDGATTTAEDIVKCINEECGFKAVLVWNNFATVFIFEDYNY